MHDRRAKSSKSTPTGKKYFRTRGERSSGGQIDVGSRICSKAVMSSLNVADIVHDAYNGQRSTTGADLKLSAQGAAGAPKCTRYGSTDDQTWKGGRFVGF